MSWVKNLDVLECDVILDMACKRTQIESNRPWNSLWPHNKSLGDSGCHPHWSRKFLIAFRHIEMSRLLYIYLHVNSEELRVLEPSLSLPSRWMTECSRYEKWHQEVVAGSVGISQHDHLKDLFWRNAWRVIWFFHGKFSPQWDAWRLVFFAPSNPNLIITPVLSQRRNPKWSSENGGVFSLQPDVDVEAWRRWFSSMNHSLYRSCVCMIFTFLNHWHWLIIQIMHEHSNQRPMSLKNISLRYLTWWQDDRRFRTCCDWMLRYWEVCGLGVFWSCCCLVRWCSFEDDKKNSGPKFQVVLLQFVSFAGMLVCLPGHAAAWTAPKK